ISCAEILLTNPIVLMKTKFTTILWSLALLVVITTACDGPKKETPTDDSYGLNFALMDTTTRPQDDFYRFVNGQWLDQNEIPDDETNWGSFGELRRNTDKDMLA